MERNTWKDKAKRIKAFDPLLFVLQRGPILLFWSALAMIVLVPCAWILSKPYYMTSGNLMISPEVKKLLSRDGERIAGSLRDYANTQIHRITSKEVLSEALYSLPREEWPLFLDGVENFDVAITRLKNRVEVSHVNRTYLLHLNITDASPKGLAPLLNSIMKAYIEHQQREQESQSHRRLVYIHKEKEKVSASIEQHKEKIDTISKELESYSFSENQNISYEYLVALQESLATAQAISVEELSSQNLARTQLEGYSVDSAKAEAKESVFKNEAVYLIKNWTYQQLQGMRASIDGLTGSNPDRVYVESRMQAMQDYLLAFEDELFESSLDIISNREKQDLVSGLKDASDRTKASLRVVNDLQKKVDKAEDEFADSSLLISLGRESRSQIERLRERRNYLEHLLAEVSLESKEPTRVNIGERADAPIGASGNNKKKLLALALMLSIFIPTGLFLCYDFIDDRLQRTSEITSLLGGEALEAIDWTDGEVHVGKNLQLQKAGIRLERSKRVGDSQVFLVTGVDKKTGNSLLTTGFAQEMSRYFKKVCILTLQALPNLEGVEIIRLREQVNGNEICDKIADLRVHNEVIFLDLPPVRNVPWVQYVCAHVDAVIISCWFKKTRYRNLYKTIDYVVSAGTPVISAVLNGSKGDPIENLWILRDQWLNQLSGWHLFFKELLQNPRSTRRLFKKPPTKSPKSLPVS